MLGLVLQVSALLAAAWATFGVGPGATLFSLRVTAFSCVGAMLLGVLLARSAQRPGAEVGTVVATCLAPMILGSVMAYQQVRAGLPAGGGALIATLAAFALLAFYALRLAAGRARQRERAASPDF
ncbi:MAG: hypothetical protein AAGD01_14540 [Acidobacteriota bacterium]